MDPVNACGNKSSYFTRDDEEDLRKEPTTAAILDKARRDANVGGPTVQARGDDKTWRMTREEQQSHVGASEAASGLHALLEVGHIAEFHAVEVATSAGIGASVGAGVVIGGAAAGLGLGIHEWLEAHHKGEEQSRALAKDELHVAMLTHLELPGGYKAEQLAARAPAGQGAGSTAMKMATPFATIDKPLVAVMQHHADLGAHAARDLIDSGISKEAFLAAHPTIAEIYKKDPAFHDGFDAMVWAKEQKDPGVYERAKASVTSRDARCAQPTVSFKS